MSVDINEAVAILERVDLTNRNSQMPGNPRYQPDELKPFLGYDSWAPWCVIVEWFWLETLAAYGLMPKKDAKLLTPKLLEKMLLEITTTDQDEIEKNTKHDILALLELMKKHLPTPLHKWLHYCATSYDIISTAYALQASKTFEKVFWPKLQELDVLWRDKILDHADTIQAGRTHLQTALPITVGFWLATLHHRFFDVSTELFDLANLPGKFSGAVGSKASQVALDVFSEAESTLMDSLEIRECKLSTQIVPPENAARFYFDLVLLSGVLANLGEDVRILQSSQFGELTSLSSSSSAMSHKTANPIAAENLAGMHESVKAEFQNVMGTLVSDLQRDLRNSSPMRQYSAVMVYVFQQIKTAIRLLKSVGVDKQRCYQNFQVSAKLVVAELLHLYLQRHGLADAHHFVNQKIVPMAAAEKLTLEAAMDIYCQENFDHPAARIWNDIPDDIKEILKNPEKYIGDAKRIALKQSEQELE